MTKGREIQGVDAQAEVVFVATRTGVDGETALLRLPPGPDESGTEAGQPLITRLAAEVRGAGAVGPVHVIGDPQAVARVPGACAHPAGSPAAVLERLAAVAAGVGRGGTGEALLVFPGDLLIDRVALLDLVDHRGRRTATFVLPAGADTTGVSAPLRRHGAPSHVASVGTAVHEVTAPDAAGLGVLRVDASHRAEAARLWTEAAAAAGRHGWAVDPLALALLALSRGGVPVAAVGLGRYPWTRPSDRVDAEHGLAQLRTVDHWALRLAQASRPDDGFYSTFVVRPLSRRLTGSALRLGLSPNTVTLLSLAAGLLAALLVASGSYAAFVAAAVLVQVSLVVDCVDGEIARYTRKFSAFGAWLDATGDRVKEYGIYAALAYAAAGSGRDLWTLAGATMVVVSYRHFADYAFGATARASLVPQAHLAAIGELDDRDGGAVDDTGSQATAARDRVQRVLAATDSGNRIRAVHWVKKVVHMPIGERCLLISLTLLSGSADVVFWTMLAVIGGAILYTTGGRTLRTVLGRTSYRPLLIRGWGELDHETDIGPVGRAFRRVASLPFAAVFLALVLPLAGLIRLDHRTDALRLAVLVLAAAALLGPALRPPATSRLLWQVPGLLWLVEATVVIGVQRAFAPGSGAAAFSLLAVLAYHRYDTIYRLRDTGEAPSAIPSMLGLGVDGRLLVLAVAAWLAPDAIGAVLAAMLAWLTLVFLGDSALSWSRWLRARPIGTA